MKKAISLLLALVLCLSLCACGDGNDGGETNSVETQDIQNTTMTGENENEISNTTLSETTTPTETQSSPYDELLEILSTQPIWFPINTDTNMLMIGSADISWDNSESVLRVKYENGVECSFPVKYLEGEYYLYRGDMSYKLNSPEVAKTVSVEITLENWQEYFIFSHYSEEEVDQWGEKTGKVKEEYILEMKPEYFQSFVFEQSEVLVRYSNGHGEVDDTFSSTWRSLFGEDVEKYCIFNVQNTDEQPFEMIRIEGTLTFVDGL